MSVLKHLKHLGLSYNHIGDEGMKAFALSLSMGALNNLRHVDLRWSLIGDEGVKAFYEALSMRDLHSPSICIAPLYRQFA